MSQRLTKFFGQDVSPQRRKQNRRSKQSPKTRALKTKPQASKSDSSSYFPRKGSGGYGMCLALSVVHLEKASGNHDLHNHGKEFDFVTNEDITPKAQSYCVHSFTQRKRGYTCWDSVKTCEKHGFVETKRDQITNIVKEIRLTYKGWNSFQSLAMESLKTMAKDEENGIDATKPIIFEKSKYALTCLVDAREYNRSRAAEKSQPNLMIANPNGKNVTVNTELKQVNVGDYLLVLKQCDDNNEESTIMLNIMIERKRMDDFYKSLREGRFIQQKMRMKQTKINKIIYVIEGETSEFCTNWHWNRNITDFRRIINHNVECWLEYEMCKLLTDDILVIRTYAGQNETYPMLNNLIRNYYQFITENNCNKLNSEIFFKSENKEDVNDDNASNFVGYMSLDQTQKHKKSQKLNEKQTFAKMLMTIDSDWITPAMAVKITNVYPSMKSLLDAYDQCTTLTQKELMISNNVSFDMYRDMFIDIDSSLANDNIVQTYMSDEVDAICNTIDVLGIDEEHEPFQHQKFWEMASKIIYDAFH